MATRPVSLGLLEQAYRAFEATKTADNPRGNYSAAARKLGLQKDTFRCRVDSYLAGRSAEATAAARPGDEDYVRELADLLKLYPSLSENRYRLLTKMPEKTRYSHRGGWNEFKARALKIAGIDAATLAARERQRYNDTIQQLRKELVDVRRELNHREDLRASIFNLVTDPVCIPSWALEEARPSADAELPMLHVSDWQIGEVITKARIGGFNEFNWEIAQERIKTLVAKTIELSFMHRGKKRYPGIYYLRGGDMISGQIHPDLMESNDLQSCEAARNLVTVETWVITQLRKAFGKVHVKSVPGNHGRSTDKTRTKWNVGTNFDVMTHYWLEDALRGDAKITFDAPPSGDAVFNVYGYNLVMTHGDRMGSRGGEGFLGAVATIARGMKKTFEYYATLGRVVDYIFCGHFHTALALEYGYSNGCLPGYSELAQGYRMRPHPPSQNLFYMHGHYGVVDAKRIIVGPAPKLSELADRELAFGA